MFILRVTTCKPLKHSETRSKSLLANLSNVQTTNIILYSNNNRPKIDKRKSCTKKCTICNTHK